MSPRVTGKQLNIDWGVGAQHALYREDGTWYHNLDRFPGVLFDINGYVLFDTRLELLNCPGVNIGKGKNWIHFPRGIAALPNYVKVLSSGRQVHSISMTDERDSDFAAIPPQGPGPHFELGPDGRVRLAPASQIDNEGNNNARIQQQLPLVRRAIDRLAGNLNPNAFPELSDDLGELRSALSQDQDNTRWGLVFGLYVMINNSAEAARREVEDRLSPALEDAAYAALETIRTLVGNLLLATGEGRALFEEADRIRMTRAEQEALQRETKALADKVKNAPNIIDLSASNLLSAAVDTAGVGPHPERGTAFSSAAIRNLGIVLVSAASIGAFAFLGRTIAGDAGFVAGTGLGFIGLKSLEATKRFEAAKKALRDQYDRLLGLPDGPPGDIAAIFEEFRIFIRENVVLFRQLASLLNQTNWMNGYLDFAVRDTPSDPVIPLETPETPPPTEPPPDFDLEQVHEMILTGKEPPPPWRPWIVALDFDGENLESLAPIAGLASLQSLDLSNTQVTDLAPIAGLASLQSLNLSNTQVTDLAPIAGLMELEAVYVESEKRRPALARTLGRSRGKIVKVL